MYEESVTAAEVGSPWLTVEEAAAYVRCSTGHLYRLRLAGRGPMTYQPGGEKAKILYRREDLDLWVESGRAAADLAAGE